MTAMHGRAACRGGGQGATRFFVPTQHFDRQTLPVASTIAAAVLHDLVY